MLKGVLQAGGGHQVGTQLYIQEWEVLELALF